MSRPHRHSSRQTMPWRNRTIGKGRWLPIVFDPYWSGVRGLFLDWYIARAGVSYGPFTAEEFARFQAEGQLTLTDEVWNAGFERWVSYEDFRSARPSHSKAPQEPITEARLGAS